MSDPIAVSILSKLSAWYDFEGNGNDSHGSYNLTITAAPGYQAGRVGQEIKPQARASVAIPSTAMTPSSGQFSLGGWLNFSTVAPLTGLFGLTNGITARNEMMTISNDNATNRFIVFGWVSGGTTTYNAEDPNNPTADYPITVQVTDTSGNVATKPQVISISQGSGIPPGFYFISATWNNGVLSLYKNGVLVATTTVTSTQGACNLFQIANAFNVTQTYCGLDSVFFSIGAVMTAQEMAWLYNNGAGWNHAGIVAAAA